MGKGGGVGRASRQAATKASRGTSIATDKAFADRVLAEAHSVPASGRFGEKVFIGDLYRTVKDRPAFRDLTLSQFKERLIRANQARHINLARADLVEAMDPAKVAASETTHFGATFHFLRVPGPAGKK